MDKRYLGNNVYAILNCIDNSSIILTVEDGNAIGSRICLDVETINELLQFIADMRKELSK